MIHRNSRGDTACAIYNKLLQITILETRRRIRHVRDYTSFQNKIKICDIESCPRYRERDEIPPISPRPLLSNPQLDLHRVTFSTRVLLFSRAEQTYPSPSQIYRSTVFILPSYPFPFFSKGPRTHTRRHVFKHYQPISIPVSAVRNLGARASPLVAE